jgi:hypothetical protein
MQHIEWYIAGAAITALLLAVGHWLPLLHPMPLIPRYVYGVGAIITGFTIWRSAAGDWLTPLALLGIAAVGGVTVAAAYGWDGVIIAIRKAKKAERNDGELH